MNLPDQPDLNPEPLDPELGMLTTWRSACFYKQHRPRSDAIDAFTNSSSKPKCLRLEANQACVQSTQMLPPFGLCPYGNNSWMHKFQRGTILQILNLICYTF